MPIIKNVNQIIVTAIVVGFSSIAFSQVLSKDDIVLYKDIIYTVVDGHELKLDIAVPKYLKSSAPAIVDIPGGAWRKVEKKAEDAIFYAKHGFIGISMTHRTSDIAIFPAAVHDCKTAVRWARANAKKYNINPDKIGITGVSSGGHLATLLGTSGGDEYLEGKGDYSEYSSSVQAVVSHFGPTDFLLKIDGDKDAYTNAHSPQALFLGGPLNEKKDLARLANPITYIDANDPPILIVHGELDGMVNIAQSEILFEALNKAKVPTKFIRVKNADHMYRPNKWDEEISPTIDELFQMTIDWFEEWLGKPDIDYNSIPSKDNPPKTESSKSYKLFYRLKIELPSKTKESYCNGRFFIRCEGETLANGIISLRDLSSEKKRIFEKQFTISGVDLTDKLLLWNFRGEIFDSEINEVFEPGFLQNEIFEDSIKGLGYDIIIGSDKSIKINKKVYRD